MISYDITPHIAGDTWDGIPAITIQKNGSAVDLTNALIEMQVRPSIDSPVYFELHQNNGITIVDPPSAGNIQIPPQIVDIPSGNYVYDIKVTFNTGEVRTELGGNWLILPHSSR